MERDDRTPPAGKREWQACWQLIKKARIPWLLIAVAFGLSIVSAKVSVLFPDYSIQFFEMGDITRHTVLVGIGLLLGAAVVSIVKSYVEAWLRTDISRRLRDKVQEKVFSLTMAGLDRINPRELISRTSDDTAMLSDFLVTVFMVLAGEVFHFYFALETIYEYHPHLFWFQVLFVPLFILLNAVQGRLAHYYQYGIQLRLARLTEYLSERLVNIPLIKIFTKEQAEIKNGEERIDEYAGIQVRSALVDVVFLVLTGLVRYGNRCVAILYGGYLVYHEQLDIGTWMAYFMLAEQATMNLEILVGQWAVLKGVQGAISRTAEIMTMDEEVYKGNPLPEGEPAFALEDVHLSRGEKEILKGITTTIEPGETIALVGSSGSGKSTILNLLLRLYEAEKGRVTEQDADVTELDLAAYRRQFGYVFQDTRLFGDSLRDNLCYGVDRPVSDEELTAVCQKVGLEAFLAKQEQGLDTLIAEGGTNVSGGEMQRIGIAQVLLRRPEIFLLDEATANLDEATERQVMEAVHEAAGGKVLVLVTHRMNLAASADRILYVEGGRILAQGTHDELMNRCEAYRRLAEAEAL